jgi:hypothetical protein
MRPATKATTWRQLVALGLTVSWLAATPRLAEAAAVKIDDAGERGGGRYR